MLTRRTTLLFIAALAACSEAAPDPLSVEAPPNTRRSSNTVPQNLDQTQTYLIRTFAHDHRRTYRLRVDRGTKTLTLAAISDEPVLGCNDPGTPSCTPTGGIDEPYIGDAQTGDLTVSGEDSVFADLSSENLSASLAEAGPYHCPRRVEDPHFVWNGHHFQIEGEVPLVQLLTMSSGIPKGRYLLPNGPWLSDDGQARIWSGTIDGTCFVVYTTWLGLITTEEGVMGWYGFHGDYEDLSGVTFAAYDPAGGGSAMYYTIGDLETMDAEAYAVLEKWLSTGACSEGWVIIVNGVREC